MKAWAAECVRKRVAVNRREPHLAQRTPACSSERLSPTFARTLSAVSRARRMQWSHSTPMMGRGLTAKSCRVTVLIVAPSRAVIDKNKMRTFNRRVNP
jgi:hypothetical protein